MSNKLLYALVGVVGLFLLVVIGLLALTLQTPKQIQIEIPVPIQTSPTQQQPTYKPLPTYTPAVKQDNSQWQLDELRRQRQQDQLRQQQEPQRLQEAQKQQMREYYLGLAEMYDDMAAAAWAQGNAIANYDSYEWPLRGTPLERLKQQEEQRQRAKPYYQLALQYSGQASYYQSLANSQYLHPAHTTKHFNGRNFVL